MMDIPGLDPSHSYPCIVQVEPPIFQGRKCRLQTHVSSIGNMRHLHPGHPGSRPIPLLFILHGLLLYSVFPSLLVLSFHLCVYCKETASIPSSCILLLLLLSSQIQDLTVQQHSGTINKNKSSTYTDIYSDFSFSIGLIFSCSQVSTVSMKNQQAYSFKYTVSSLQFNDDYELMSAIYIVKSFVYILYTIHEKYDLGK